MKECWNKGYAAVRVAISGYNRGPFDVVLPADALPTTEKRHKPVSSGDMGIYPRALSGIF